MTYWKIKYEPDRDMIDQVWRDDQDAAASLKKCDTWNVLCDTEAEAIADFNRWNRTGRRMIGRPEKCSMSKKEYENG